MKIGILTGGGDCPGLNAVIRAVTVRAIKQYGDEVVGIRNGWRGLVDDEMAPLGYEDVAGVIDLGGTILGTSRTNPIGDSGMMTKIEETIRGAGLDGVIAVGGDDTLGVCLGLHREGYPTVGVPKTIDNDLRGTDYTFGFQTAVTIATEAADRLRTTAASHHRFMVLEVMGRHAGWIALESGMAAGADLILVPEFPFDLDEVCATLKSCHDRKGHAVLVVAEGAHERDATPNLITQHKELDAFGNVMLGGAGPLLANRIAEQTGIQTRATVLGYVQRGGPPVAFDRVLGTRFGVAAIDAVHRGGFGKMVALRGETIGLTPLEEAVAGFKLVDRDTWKAAEALFG